MPARLRASGTRPRSVARVITAMISAITLSISVLPDDVAVNGFGPCHQLGTDGNGADAGKGGLAVTGAGATDKQGHGEGLGQRLEVPLHHLPTGLNGAG